jgi:hypothetical protein
MKNRKTQKERKGEQEGGEMSLKRNEKKKYW